MNALDHIFGTTGALSWSQECARAVLIFACGLVAVRLAGRRVFGRWAAIDIVVAFVVGSNLSRALTGNAPLWGTLLATALLMAMHWLIARAAVQWSAVSTMVEGRSVTLVERGHRCTPALYRYGVSQRDLDEAVRRAGRHSLADVESITLEPSGQITVTVGTGS